jgi:hypothetical protein
LGWKSRKRVKEIVEKIYLMICGAARYGKNYRRRRIKRLRKRKQKSRKRRKRS